MLGKNENALLTHVRTNPSELSVALLLRACGYSLETFLAFPEAVAFVIRALKCDVWSARTRMFNLRKRGGFDGLKHGSWREPSAIDPDLCAEIRKLKPEKNRNSRRDVESVAAKFPHLTLGYLIYAWEVVGKKGRVSR